MSLAQSHKISAKGHQEETHKFLTFHLGGQVYGVDILAVREIIRMVHVTPIPNSPEEVCGVINLRGKIIPVLDIKIHLSIKQSELTDLACIVVLDRGDSGIGVVVDRVIQVLALANSQMERHQGIANRHSEKKRSHIKNIGKHDSDIIMMVDVDSLLSAHQHLTDELIENMENIEVETSVHRIKTEE